MVDRGNLLSSICLAGAGKPAGDEIYTGAGNRLADINDRSTAGGISSHGCSRPDVSQSAFWFFLFTRPGAGIHLFISSPHSFYSGTVESHSQSDAVVVVGAAISFVGKLARRIYSRAGYYRFLCRR